MRQSVVPSRIPGARRPSELGGHHGWVSLPLVVRYGVAGGLTQVVYLGTLGLALSGGVHYVVGMGVAHLVAMTFAFPVYRRRVFRDRESPLRRQLVAFLGVWWTGAAVSVVAVPLMVELLGVQPFTAQVLVLVVVATASFVTHYGVTFRGTGAQ